MQKHIGVDEDEKDIWVARNALGLELSPIIGAVNSFVIAKVHHGQEMLWATDDTEGNIQYCSQSLNYADLDFAEDTWPATHALFSYPRTDEKILEEASLSGH